MATLAGTNLTIDGSTAIEAISLTNSSATLNDTSNITFQRTAIPSGTVASQRTMRLISKGPDRAGTAKTSAELSMYTVTVSAIPTSLEGRINLDIYSSNAYSSGWEQTKTNLTWYYNNGNRFQCGNTFIGPGDVDNGIDAGQSAVRYRVVYAATGTINTSDVNEKEQIADLDAAELRVATAVKTLIKKFKWKNAVAEKGDGARIHVGVIAQEVEAAFVAEGLDPAKYALFCKDVWWEREEENPSYRTKWVRDEVNPENPSEKIQKEYEYEVEGAVFIEIQKPTKIVVYKTEVEGGVRKERKGIRYDQLLAFVIAAL